MIALKSERMYVAERDIIFNWPVGQVCRLCIVSSLFIRFALGRALLQTDFVLCLVEAFRSTRHFSVDSHDGEVE